MRQQNAPSSCSLTVLASENHLLGGFFSAFAASGKDTSPAEPQSKLGCRSKRATTNVCCRESRLQSSPALTPLYRALGPTSRDEQGRRVLSLAAHLRAVLLLSRRRTSSQSPETSAPQTDQTQHELQKTSTNSYTIASSVVMAICCERSSALRMPARRAFKNV